MRILLCLSYHLPHISGLTLALDRLARDLADAGHEVTVLTGRHERSLPREETRDGVRIRRVPVWFRLGKALVMPGMAPAAWREARQADVVHLWLPKFDAGPVALAARLRGRRIFATYNCSLTSPGLLGWLAVAAVNASHLVAGLCCRRIVVVSEDYAAQSRFCRIFRRRVTHISVPVPAWPATLGAWQPAAPPYRIGFVGRISREKGLATLLAAIPRLREQLPEGFTVELAGPGADSEEGKRLLEGAEAPELVVHGLLDDDGRDRFYRSLDVLVLPSDDRIEAFGLVQIEAMLRGVPCVTSDRPGMRQPVLRTGFGRLFAPRDPAALARAIAETLRLGPPSKIHPRQIAAAFSNDAVRAAYERVFRER